MQNETSLYIPMGVKAENELFNGFGKRELLQSATGSHVGGAVDCTLYGDNTGALTLRLST